MLSTPWIRTAAGVIYELQRDESRLRVASESTLLHWKLRWMIVGRKERVISELFPQKLIKEVSAEEEFKRRGREQVSSAHNGSVVLC